MYLGVVHRCIDVQMQICILVKMYRFIDVLVMISSRYERGQGNYRYGPCRHLLDSGTRWALRHRDRATLSTFRRWVVDWWWVGVLTVCMTKHATSFAMSAISLRCFTCVISFFGWFHTFHSYVLPAWQPLLCETFVISTMIFALLMWFHTNSAYSVNTFGWEEFCRASMASAVDR